MIRLLAIICTALFATLVHSQDSDGGTEATLDTLFGALDIEGTIEVMHQEGLTYGEQIAEDLFGDSQNAAWSATLRKIYVRERMIQLVETEMATELDGVNLEPLIAFFTSQSGRKIVAFEVSARRAFMDTKTEEEALIRLENAEREDTEVLGQVETIISDSDLIESNVMGSLNSSLMFYRGLADGGGYDLDETEMLRTVWSQEDDTRAETESWLRSYLLMSYSSVPPEELETYAALYRTPEGKALNRALFSAFNQMYDELSYLLGLAAADFMNSEKL